MRSAIGIPNRFRGFFFLQFFGIGVFFSYAALYFASIGLPGWQTGLLLALVPLVGFLVQPLWGLLSDVYHIHRPMLVFACFGVAATMTGFSLTQDFRLLVLFTILHAIMRAPISILGNALALEFLDQGTSHESFGSLRLWGSIGFAIASFSIGALFVGNTIWWIIPIYALSNLALALVALTIPNAEVHGKVLWREGISLLLSERVLVWYLLGVFLIGITLGIVNNFLAVYLVDISAAGWLIGVAFAISALVEVPLMARVPVFIKRWGIRLPLVAGVAVLPIRWLLYAIIDEPLLVLPTQVLHSIAMTSLLVIGVLYVDRLLAPKLRASGQSLYTASLHGLGPSIGLYIAGLIYQQAGIDLVWLLCAVISLAGTLIIGYAIYRHPDNQPKQKAIS